MCSGGRKVVGHLVNTKIVSLFMCLRRITAINISCRAPLPSVPIKDHIRQIASKGANTHAFGDNKKAETFDISG